MRTGEVKGAPRRTSSAVGDGADHRGSVSNVAVTIEEHTDALNYVRNHPRLFLGDAQPSGVLFVHELLDQVFALGVKEVTITCHEAWWVLSCASDWFLDDRPAREQVRQIVPLPELGPNSCRKEIIAVAFARGFATREGGSAWVVLSGPDVLPGAVEAAGETKNGRAVAFRF